MRVAGFEPAKMTPGLSRPNIPGSSTPAKTGQAGFEPTASGMKTRRPDPLRPLPLMEYKPMSAGGGTRTRKDDADSQSTEYTNSSTPAKSWPGQI